MIVKTARRGGLFYGCPTCPMCDGSRSYSDPTSMHGSQEQGQGNPGLGSFFAMRSPLQAAAQHLDQQVQ
eukprot:12923970-Prorocentrum_lima.AAC.1